MLCADVPAASELKDSRESLDIATMDMQESMSRLNYCGGLHDAAYRGLKDAGRRTTETKQKADDTHDQIRTHRGSPPNDGGVRDG